MLPDADLQRILAAIAPIAWPCAYCHMLNETPTVLWNTVKYQLICARCGNMQNYPGHIARHDPLPTDSARASYQENH